MGKKVEFETSHKPPNICFLNSTDEERNANNPLHIITKRNQYCLICLYCFGLLVISIGIILLVAGSINNSIDETVGTEHPKSSKLEMEDNKHNSHTYQNNIKPRLS